MTDIVTYLIHHEGSVSHLYLDTRGNVTVGVGFMIPSPEHCQDYDWTPGVGAALQDFHRVAKMAPAHPAPFYKRACNARMTETAIRETLEGKVASLRDAISEHWCLIDHPVSVQIALLDMAYNLGVAGLAKFGDLHEYVLAGEYEKAATECSRRGVSESRNSQTAHLFLAGATEDDTLSDV